MDGGCGVGGELKTDFGMYWDGQKGGTGNREEARTIKSWSDTRLVEGITQHLLCCLYAMSILIRSPRTLVSS